MLCVGWLVGCSLSPSDPTAFGDESAEGTGGAGSQATTGVSTDDPSAEGTQSGDASGTSLESSGDGLTSDSSTSTSSPSTTDATATGSSDSSSSTGTPDPCGNGTIDPPEQCDGQELGGATCESEGFGGGTLACDDDCTFDYSSCTDPACAMAPRPPGGVCPAECTGGCDMGSITCSIHCIGTTACQNVLVDCPENWACHVLCDGTRACEGATIDCPADYACSVLCDGTTPCDDAVFACGNGPCTVTCEGTSPCEGSTLQCGAGDGLVHCTNVTSVNPDPVAVPDAQSSCMCEVMGC